MRNPNTQEKAFEEAIESVFLEKNHYTYRSPKDFDREDCLDKEIFCDFVKTSQPKTWEKLENKTKGQTKDHLIRDLKRALDSPSEGMLSVFRKGFKCAGERVQVVFYQPSSTLNPESARQYACNQLTIMRQVKYSLKHENSIDLVLAVNGIPVVTMELKNPLSNQTVLNAMTQYRMDRDRFDKLFQFNKRSFIHFAVDTEEVYMTSELKGESTYFLPFNKGYLNGQGNPPSEQGGYRTSYLWEEILTKHSLLQIISQFLHKEEDKSSGKERLIFPRYHQLEAVRWVVQTAKKEGTGHKYLIQHSAGSGKTNTIAWLSHHLASLHDDKDQKIFSSVIVISDRTVLDRQLQRNLKSFEQTEGVVQTIDKRSDQLATAIQKGIPIIVTTLQKFSHINLESSQGKTYAIVIDEAHSSMGGEAEKDMRANLGALEEEEMDEEDVMVQEVSKRGGLKNLSFFAFTATPKAKTLELFGRVGAEGKKEVFHLYSMKQALEEKFILDVLANYITYKTYYKLAQIGQDDPELDKKKGSLALRRYVQAHEVNLQEKVKVIVEHFLTHTRSKIGGKAKAMVVTASREQAVRYKRAIEARLKEVGSPEVGVLVAFSGSITENGESFTEEMLNGGLSPTELPKKFQGSEYSFLVVANKYQTGFDQPLLHTMYVDKTLGGVQAIQTLSRINRTYLGKDSTFILDFINDPIKIQEAFAPYYEKTIMGDSVEYGKLYELQSKLEAFELYWDQDLREFAGIYFSAPKRELSPKSHAQMNHILDKSVERFKYLQEEEKEEFKSLLSSFKNLYSWFSQVISFRDFDLERLYVYLRHLRTKLPFRDKTANANIEDNIELEYYRLEKSWEGSIVLNTEEANPLKGATDVGTRESVSQRDKLSKLLISINDRFNTDFKEEDVLFLEAVQNRLRKDESVQQSARVNDFKNFEIGLRDKIENIFIESLKSNEDLVKNVIEDEDLKKEIYRLMIEDLYDFF